MGVRAKFEQVVHTGTLDGKTVQTTWAPTRAMATRFAEEFRTEGADLTRIFTDGGIEKYRVVGYWPAADARAVASAVAEIDRNVDALYADTITHAAFDAAQRAAWERIERSGLRDDVAAVFGKRGAR